MTTGEAAKFLIQIVLIIAVCVLGVKFVTHEISANADVIAGVLLFVYAAQILFTRSK